MGRRSSERERFWRRQVSSQAASGLSVREYCRRERLSEASFYAWRRELPRRRSTCQKSRPAGAAHSAYPDRGPDAPCGVGAFLPVTVVSGHEPALEVALPRGIVVRVWPGASAALLRDMLAALVPSAVDSQRQAGTEAR